MTLDAHSYKQRTRKLHLFGEQAAGFTGYHEQG